MKIVKPNKPNKPNKLKEPNKLVLGFIVLLIVTLPPANTWADVSDILSRFQIYADVEETYDTNVDLTPDNERDDFITNVGVGIRFSTLPRAETTREFRQPLAGEEAAYGLNLDFFPSYVIYGKSTYDDYLSLAGNLDTWYTWKRRLTFRVRDYIIRSEDPREREYTTGALPEEYVLSTQRGQRAIYFRNVVTPSLEYQFGRENRISLNYVNNIYRNRNPQYEDSTENNVNLSFAYWFDIRNGINLGYGFTDGDFETSPNLIGHMATGGYTHRFNPRTSVSANFAYFRRDFDFPGDDYNIYRPSVGIQHAFSQTLNVNLDAGYFLADPKTGSSEDGFYLNFLLQQLAERTTYTLALQAGYAEDYFTSENLGFNLYQRGIATISHQLLQRLTVGISGSLEHVDYVSQPGDRKDWIWGVWGNASYQLWRWLSLSLRVSYRADNSKVDIYDYTDFRATLGIRATY